MSAASDSEVLAYNAWDGDETDVLTLSDRMGVTRKPATCAICFGPIAKGERVRLQTQLNREERKVMTFRFCALCCAAMASSWTDDGAAICERAASGMRKAGG